MYGGIYGGGGGGGGGGIGGAAGGKGAGFINPWAAKPSQPVTAFKIGQRVKLNALAPLTAYGLEGVVYGIAAPDVLVDFATIGRYPCRPELLEPVEEGAAAPAAVEKPKPPALCDFCGGDNACAEHTSALRAAEKTWAVCGRMGCYESIPFHEERLTAGLFDSPETRRVTRDWVLERRKVK